MVLATVTQAEEAYYEITKRLLDEEIFEGTVLDIYHDLKNDCQDGIFDEGYEPDIVNMLYLINEEVEYIITKFCQMSGLDEEDIAKSVAKWNDEIFSILPRMIEKVLIRHGLSFINTYEIIGINGISSRSDTILPCQNILFPQFKNIHDKGDA